jgi:outer membrane protein TolC
LQIYTNSSGPVTATDLKRNNASVNILEIKNDSSLIRNNPSILFSDQQQIIGKKTLALEKNRFLPGFTFGYLNQAGRNTPMDLRFRAGINIPLWFWQYTGSIGAAKIGVKIAEQKAAAQRQLISAEMQKAQGDYLKFNESLRYYENKGLRLTDEILSASKRFFESGKESYITYLKNINDAYVIRLKYAESLRNFNQSVININYLTGTL